MWNHRYACLLVYMTAFPPETIKTIALYHLSTAAGLQSYSLDSTVTEGAFMPMTDHKHALLGGEFSNPTQLYVDADADVRVSDKVIIDSVNYYIAKIFNGQWGSLRHKRCILSTDA